MENAKKRGFRALAWVLTLALLVLAFPLFTVTAEGDCTVKFSGTYKTGQYDTTNIPADHLPQSMSVSEGATVQVAVTYPTVYKPNESGGTEIDDNSVTVSVNGSSAPFDGYVIGTGSDHKYLVTFYYSFAAPASNATVTIAGTLLNSGIPTVKASCAVASWSTDSLNDATISEAWAWLYAYRNSKGKTANDTNTDFGSFLDTVGNISENQYMEITYTGSFNGDITSAASRFFFETYTNVNEHPDTSFSANKITVYLDGPLTSSGIDKNDVLRYGLHNSKETKITVAANTHLTVTVYDDSRLHPATVEKHIITIDDTIVNGKVSAKVGDDDVESGVTKAAAGTQVTLTADPDEDYEFSDWNVTDADSKTVTVTGNQFTMPSSDVTVSATFVEEIKDVPNNLIKNGLFKVKDEKAPDFGWDVSGLNTWSFDNHSASIVCYNNKGTGLIQRVSGLEPGAEYKLTVTVDGDALNVYIGDADLGPASGGETKEVPFTATDETTNIEFHGWQAKSTISNVSLVKVETTPPTPPDDDDDDPISVADEKDGDYPDGDTASGHITWNGIKYYYENSCIVSRGGDDPRFPPTTTNEAAHYIDNVYSDNRAQSEIFKDSDTKVFYDIDMPGAGKFELGWFIEVGDEVHKDLKATPLHKGHNIGITDNFAGENGYLVYTAISEGDDSCEDNAIPEINLIKAVLLNGVEEPNVTQYAVKVADNTNGTVTTSGTTDVGNGKLAAAVGETVTLTAAPANGYEFDSWNVTTADGTSVEVTGNQFTMPASTVTVSANFTPLPLQNLIVNGDFSDGTTNHWTLLENSGMNWVVEDGKLTYKKTVDKFTKLTPELTSPLKANTTYTISGDIVATSGNEKIYFQITKGNKTARDVNDRDMKWRNGSFKTSFTTDSSLDDYVLSLYADQYVDGASFSIDNLRLVEGDVAEAMDAKYSAALTLNENIDINLKIASLGADFDKSNMTITVNGDPVLAEKLTFDKTASTVIAKVVAVQPNHMADNQRIVVSYNGTTVKTINYSVRAYCESVFKKDSTSDEKLQQLKALCEAVLNYGAATAVYTNADNANQNVNNGHKIDFSKTDYIPASTLEIKPGDRMVADGATCNLTLGSTITMNIHVTMKEGYTINTSEHPTDPEQDNTFVILSSANTLVDEKNIHVEQVEGTTDEYLIEIKNITSSKLARTYTLMFWKDVEEVQTEGLDGVAEVKSSITFGVYNYCYTVQQNAENLEPTYPGLLNLCKAIYNYGEAAKTYHPDTKPTT